MVVLEPFRQRLWTLDLGCSDHQETCYEYAWPGPYLEFTEPRMGASGVWFDKLPRRCCWMPLVTELLRLTANDIDPFNTYLGPYLN